MLLIRAFFEVITDAWKDLWRAAKEMAEAEERLNKSLVEMHEALRKEPKMDALKLDVKAIRERVLEKAVVICTANHCLHPNTLEFLIPQRGRSGDWIGLVNGGSWDRNLATDSIRWLIRPGDEAEFSDDGINWVRGTYRGLNGYDLFDQGDSAPHSFSSNKGYYPYIRPVPQESEELKQARAEVKAAREHLEKAEKRLNEVKR